jgi:hypothetical protein
VCIANLKNVSDYPDVVKKEFNKEDAREITMW